jgi:hypothetical protein
MISSADSGRSCRRLDKAHGLNGGPIMKSAFMGICCLALLALPPASFAGEDPPCLDQGSTVMVQAGDVTKGWLTRESADAVKARLLQSATGDKTHWDEDTLVISCAIGGGTAYEMSAATVTGSARGDDAPAAKQLKNYINSLAARSGHTQKEADDIYAGYSKLSGFYRNVPDPEREGGWIGEDALIQRRIAKQFGDVKPTAAPRNSGNDQQRVAEFKAKVLAAQKKGDTQELLRLTQEAQKLPGQGTAAQGTQITRATDEQAWQIMVAAYPELAKVCWPTRVTRLAGACLPCSWMSE